FSSRRRHTRFSRDWSSDVCSSDLMDLKKINYNSDLYNEYIHGSAEVVGLMCLQVFTEADKKKYQELKPYAMKLGSAFQKINFLRDLKDDFQELGRTYFPNVNMLAFNDHIK